MMINRKDNLLSKYFSTSAFFCLTLLVYADHGKAQYREFLSIPDTVGYPGDTVYVQTMIAAEGPCVIFAMEGTVQDNVELSSYSLENSVFDTTLWEYNIQLDNNFFEATFVPDTSDFPIPGNGVALNLVVVIPTGLPPCQAATVAEGLISDTLGFAFIDTARGILNILEMPWERGDINHDAVIDYLDLGMLRGYIYEGSAIPAPIGVGDINRDDFVDLVDLLQLRDMIFGR